MNGIEDLKLVALDSNIFIYNFEKNPQFLEKVKIIFSLLQRQKLKAVTSTVSLIESLSYPSPPKVLRAIKKGFATLGNLNIVDVNFKISLETARIRREYKFRLPDSIQLATAKVNKAQVFITNDARLKQFKEIKVILIEEVN